LTEWQAADGRNCRQEKAEYKPPNIRQTFTTTRFDSRRGHLDFKLLAR